MTEVKPIPPGSSPGAAAVASIAAASAGTSAPQPAGQTQAGGQSQAAAAPSSPAVSTTDDIDDEVVLEGQQAEVKEAYKKLPSEVRKINSRIFTQRAMALAAEKKQHEADLELARSVRQNPREFAQLLAQRVGLKVAPEPTVAERQGVTIADELAPFLGNDKQAAATFASIVGKAIEAQVAPDRQRLQQATAAAVEAEQVAHLRGFVSAHPEAKPYVPEMQEVLTALQGSDLPTERMLEIAYAAATRNAKIGSSVAETVGALQAAAAAAAGNGNRNAEGPVAAAPPSERPSARDAALAAIQGVQWER